MWLETNTVLEDKVQDILNQTVQNVNLNQNNSEKQQSNTEEKNYNFQLYVSI